ncbi:MAG: Gfo/Idh/MocA family oxidoreductase [Planctomycetaceae bacterium]|jgi:myo-inositol 2-dehydrogenase/D-chiro-inositol 1-dehydrogenase|nr:Gfo/Idh/MocA family oxidoreductase [Planctomycetaceae bacterium]
MTNYGIIGGGAWGQCYAKAIVTHAELELTAIAETNDDVSSTLRKNFPNVSVLSDYHDLLATDTEIIAVVVPNHLHYQIGSDVLRSGKHLLIEKPFALNTEECDDLIRLSAERKRTLVVGHQFRLSSLWGKIKEKIDAGFIGRPRYSLIELSRNPFRQGVDGWRYDPQRVGDWILEEPIHFLDLACWYFERFSSPVSVTAVSNATTSEQRLHENVGAQIEFSDGAFAVVAQTTGAFEHHQTVKVVGEEGTLWGNWSGALDRTRSPEFFLKAFDGHVVREVPIENTPGELFELEEQIVRMTKIIRGESPIHCTGIEGRFAVRLSQAVQESSQQQKRVEL